MEQNPLHKRKLGREAPDLIKTQKYLTSPYFLGMNYHQTHSGRDLFHLTRPIVYQLNKTTFLRFIMK